MNSPPEHVRCRFTNESLTRIIETTCRCSSTVERSFRKAEVVGPIPTIGCVCLQYVTIDLQGFRSGSLNEPLTEAEEQRNL